jgi:hypothetical protein
MAWAAVIASIAPSVLESLDSWLAAGKITQEQYDEAKGLFTKANERANDAVADFEAWLNSPDD